MKYFVMLVFMVVVPVLMTHLIEGSRMPIWAFFILSNQAYLSWEQK